MSRPAHARVSVLMDGRYLSAEQRLNYLVRIDEEGLIRWSVVSPRTQGYHKLNRSGCTTTSWWILLIPQPGSLGQADSIGRHCRR